MNSCHELNPATWMSLPPPRASLPPPLYICHPNLSQTLSCDLCVAVWCSVLQYVAVWRSVVQCVVACCSVLQCVAVCCSVLQCVAVCCSHTATHCSTQHAHRHTRILTHTFSLSLRTSTHCNILQYIATHANTLQHTARCTPPHIITRTFISSLRVQPPSLPLSPPTPQLRTRLLQLLVGTLQQEFTRLQLRNRLRQLVTLPVELLR